MLSCWELHSTRLYLVDRIPPFFLTINVLPVLCIVSILIGLEPRSSQSLGQLAFHQSMKSSWIPTEVEWSPPKIHVHLDWVFFRQTHGRRKIGHFYLVTWKQGGELSCSPPAKWKPCRALWNPFLWGEMDGWKAHYNPIAKLQHCPCQFGTVSGLEVHGMLLWSIASLPTVTAVGCNFRF